VWRRNAEGRERLEGRAAAEGVVRRRFAELGLALAALGAPAALAQTLPTRTLEECVAIAIERQPTLGAAEANVEAGRQRVRQEIAGYLPQISGSASANRNMTSAAQKTGLPGTGTSQQYSYYAAGFSLSQVLFDFGRNLDAIQSAQALRDSLAADADTQRETIIRDVKQAYFDLLAARRLRDVAEETLRSNQRQLDLARGRYDVGFATKLDVTRSEVLVANTELDLLTARNAVLVAEQTLRHAMGLTEPLDFDLVDVLEATPVEIPEQRALAIALEHRPELVSIRAQIRAADETASARWKEHLPDVTGGAKYNWSGSTSPLKSSWNYGALVNVPLFSGGLIDARVGEARANALSLGFQEQSLKQDVALEVRRATLDLARAREAITVSERAREQARENLELAEGRYQAGVGNVIELTDAQAQRASAEAEYVRSLYGFHTAVAELERAIGQELPQS
jgi:outer membrane protein